MTRPPLSDGWDTGGNVVARTRRQSGRFVSAYGMHIISGPPGSPYPRLVLDRDWQPVGALNEWYRLRANVAAPSTRDTYLRVLSPFFGFLLMQNWPGTLSPRLCANTRERTCRLLVAYCGVTERGTASLLPQAYWRPGRCRASMSRLQTERGSRFQVEIEDGVRLAAVKFRDNDVEASVNAAFRLWWASRLRGRRFSHLIRQAREMTQARISLGRVEHGEPGQREAMPYFFAVLRELV